MATEIDFNLIKNTKILNNTQEDGSCAFIGQYNDQDIIFKLKPTTNQINFDDMHDIVFTYRNDRFAKYSMKGSCDYDTTIIYPINQDDIVKYTPTRIKMIETYQMYNEILFPEIVKQDLTWIDNIINGISEVDKVIFNNDDFVLLPDMKWASGKIEDLYYLAILKDKSLRSIRDLNASHVELLENMRDICIKKISELHQINTNQLRLYFHYHPSFWQLHIHINLMTKSWNGSTVDYAHLLHTVINNIKMCADYYQKIDMEIKVFPDVYN